MLAGPSAEFFLARIFRGLKIFFEPFDRDATAAVRRHYPPIFGISPLFRIGGDVVGKFVKYRKHRAFTLAGSYCSGLIELSFKNACRISLALRGDERQEPFLLRHKASANLPDNSIGVCAARQYVTLIKQAARRATSGQNIAIKRAHLQRG